MQPFFILVGSTTGCSYCTPLRPVGVRGRWLVSEASNKYYSLVLLLLATHYLL